MSKLFNVMCEGRLYGSDDTPWFDGGLFKKIKLPLRNAAARNGSAIDGSIFGTLFERRLDPAKRSQLGVRYTDPATVRRLVKPSHSGHCCNGG